MRPDIQTRNQPQSDKPARLRSQPSQERSRRTFEGILSAAAALLDEVGWEGFNTNLLAEKAGCRVSTIYRYFPDKLAVVSVLAERVTALWRAELAGVGTEIETGRDLQEVWREYLPKFVTVVQTAPGALAIRKAMRVVPELQVIDDADSALLADLLGAALAKRLPHLSAARAKAAARTLIESGAALFDHAHRAPAEEMAELLRELSAMHEAYLSRLERSRPTTEETTDA